jgi:hypothetical protein
MAKAFRFLLAGGLRKYRAIHADTVAAAMVSCARQDRPGVHIYHYDEIKRLAGRG